MGGQAGSVPQVSVSGQKILTYEHFNPVTGMRAWWILATRMASSCIACCVFHIISTPFTVQLQRYSFKGCQSYGRRESYHFCVWPCLLCSRILFQNSSPGSLSFFHLRNLAETSHMNPRRKWPRYRANPFNRAPVKSPKSFAKFSMCSCERAGWLGSQDLGKCAENYAIWTQFSPVTGRKAE